MYEQLSDCSFPSQSKVEVYMPNAFQFEEEIFILQCSFHGDNQKLLILKLWFWASSGTQATHYNK